jgi:hypothetical protein
MISVPLTPTLSPLGRGEGVWPSDGLESLPVGWVELGASPDHSGSVGNEWPHWGNELPGFGKSLSEDANSLTSRPNELPTGLNQLPALGNSLPSSHNSLPRFEN